MDGAATLRDRIVEKPHSSIVNLELFRGRKLYAAGRALRLRGNLSRSSQALEAAVADFTREVMSLTDNLKSRLGLEGVRRVADKRENLVDVGAEKGLLGSFGVELLNGSLDLGEHLFLAFQDGLASQSQTACQLKVGADGFAITADTCGDGAVTLAVVPTA
jgi:hypothetical protein